MTSTIKGLLLATAFVTGSAGLAMAQRVPVDAAQEAPDTVYNPAAQNAYGVSEQGAIGRSGRFSYNSGYRGRAMIDAHGEPYAANTASWLLAPGRDQSDLGEF